MPDMQKPVSPTNSVTAAMDPENSIPAKDSASQAAQPSISARTLTRWLSHAQHSRPTNITAHSSVAMVWLYARTASAPPRASASPARLWR